MKRQVQLIILISANALATAQAPQLVKVTPPSPNAAAFQKYGEIPVGPYTGVPDISIPVYTVQFRDLTIPISLSYHASGIRVNEESSQVGLGWTINTGGCISRNIVGVDDFVGNAYFNNWFNDLPDITYNHGPLQVGIDGCLLPRFNRNIPQNPTLDTFDLTSYFDAGHGIFDFQPDQYFYNFLGHSGKFVIRRNRAVAIQKAEKIEVTCLDTLGNAFRIRDLGGFVYDFTQYETYYENPGNIPHHSAWYLTKVTSPSGNSVAYKYSVISNRIYTQGSYSRIQDDYRTPIYAPSCGLLYFPDATPLQEGMAPPKNYSQVQLDTIEFTNGIVKFSYSGRSDVQGDRMLDSISIYARDAQGILSTTPLKTISLGHSYFDYGATDNDFGDPTYASKRLKLTQVLEKGYYGGTLVQASPYKFTYNEGSINLPSKNSFARDHWNYYNGKATNTSLIPGKIPINSPDLITSNLGGQGPERDPAPSYMQAFTLSSIKYPTGGSTEFQYEANDFDEVQSQVNDASYFGQTYSVVEQSQIITYDNLAKHFTGTDTLDLRGEYLYQNAASQTSSYMVHMLARFRFSNPGSDCSRYFNSNRITFDIYDSSGTNVIIHKDMGEFGLCSGNLTNNCLFCQAGVFSYNTDVILPPTKYVIRFYADPIFNTALQDVGWTFKYYIQQAATPGYTNTNTRYTIGGGLRIKRIIDHDSLNIANDRIKRFVYHYWADSNSDGVLEEYSYGKRMSKPNYAYFMNTHEYVSNCGLIPNCCTASGFSSHLMRASDSNTPLNGSAGGAVVGYSQVIMLEGENGENGKTVYRYINAPDIINPYNDDNKLPMFPPFGSTIPEQLNGYIISQIDYAANGKKVKEVANSYNSIMDNENTIYGLDARPYQGYITTLSQPPSRIPIATQTCDRRLIVYWLQKSAWNYLDSTIEKIYAQGDDTKFEETTTKYFYEDTSHLLPTRIVTRNSKGETVTSKNTYPLSYTTATAADAITQGIANLKNKHIINALVEKYVQKVNSNGSNPRVTSGVITTYGSSIPLPTLAYATETVSAITNFSALAINLGGATFDSRYKPQIFFDGFDSYGNILQQHKASDISTAYIWDYNASLLIAECINAASNEIAYTSLEWNGTGNWIIPSSTRSIANAVTGKKSYGLISGNITKTIANTAKSYVITFWTKSGTATVNGSSASTSLTRNGWTYNEIIIAPGVNSVTIAGTATIDELRLYPSDAQMITYTYEPLVGLTTRTDINNRISYYEYDGLGRLMLVRDMFGNIVKTMTYHYKN